MSTPPTSHPKDYTVGVGAACGLGPPLPRWTCETSLGSSSVRSGVGVVNRQEKSSWPDLLTSGDGPSWVEVPTLCGWGPGAVVPGLGQAGGWSRAFMGRCDGGHWVRGVLRLLDRWVT